MFQHLRTLGGALVCVAALTTSFASAAEKPALLSMMAGTWNCTSTGPDGTTTSSGTFTATSSGWLLYSGHTSAHGKTPASDSSSLIGYDSKAGEFVSMGGSTIPGDWGVGTAKASPSALTMTFTSNYPADPTNEKDTYTFSATKMTWTSTWTKHGKAMKSAGSCTKS